MIEAEDITVSVGEAVKILNEIHKADPTILTKLVDYRVPCNRAIADHPSVQVRSVEAEYEVGLLGILNGLFGIGSADYGCIGADYDCDGNLIGFVVL